MSVDPTRDALRAELPVTDRRLVAAGITTAVLEGGDGPPVVLLHGPGESAFHWMRVIPSLCAAHRVVAPDLPGHGASGAAPDGGPASTVDWLDELVDQSCDSPPVVVGATLGGAVAARFAAAHPGRLDALVLVDTLGLTAFAPDPRFGQALNGFLARPDRTTQEELWRVCAYDVDRIRDALGATWESAVGYHLGRIATPAGMAGLGSLMQEFALQAIPPNELERIEAPTTLVWGRHDLATELAVAEGASARYGWPLHVIERCADAPALEQPEALLETLRTSIGRMEVTR
jgi:pimeloyl-ACP methyl ester carboxylesterase